MTQFVCIGVPYCIGERMAGRTEVNVMRESGIAESIGAAWIDVEPDFAAHADPVVAVNRALADVIAAHRDHFPIVFAGDCTSSLGAVMGLSHTHADLGIVWFDAHGDFNTHETSPGGFLGGMPLAMLVGRGQQDLMHGIGVRPVDEAHVIITDARDLDPEEAVALKGSAITHLEHVSDLLTAPLPDVPLYVHLDVDVVRLDEMPGMSYPAEGGPSLDETAAAAARVARDGRAAGLLLGLWNQDLVDDSDSRPRDGTLALTRAFVDGLGG
ncbi:MAG: arginase family protein [Anaerolineae bacterium]|nr:arginase family protein [Anaerolineae bacterium]